ncbi:Smc5-Smc6 complex subunit [Maudiozyma humilis]|uniref:Smc5-Smc6 complex subunit n=1 Tax=Maudiozyma humilis TaxID=51915 RepID=A0AAV5S6L4_MAUHU|nr:Smc5-Smc6 complex subunit [Kazachstania humilis]
MNSHSHSPAPSALRAEGSPSDSPSPSSLRDSGSGVPLASLAAPARLCQHILSSTQSRSTPLLPRERLVRTVRELNRELGTGTRTPFAAVYDSANALLRSAYGYELTPVQPLTPTPNATATSAHPSRAAQFILRNALPPQPRLAAMQRAQTAAMHRDSAEDAAADPSLEHTLRGLTALIVSLTLLSHNNLLHTELARHLRAFGVPADGTPIPVLQCSLEQLLRRLERSGYIARHEEGSGAGGEAAPAAAAAPDALPGERVVVYRVGPRSAAEFGAAGLARLLQTLMGVAGDAADAVAREVLQMCGDTVGS